MAFNLEEETIDGYRVSAETKKLWAVEMDLAKHLLEVCEKHNLKIWASGGTLLGTVRHKGFIPWDDDMDFVMMRDDYNKFLAIGPSEFKEPYFFQSFYTDSFWGGMIKIRRSDTAMIPSHYQLREYNMGVFIDVFVMDAIPDDKNEFQRLYKRVKLLRKLLHNNNIVHPRYLSPVRRAKHALVSMYFKMVSPASLQKKIVNLLSSHSIKDNKECGLIDFCALSNMDISKVLRGDKHSYDETVMMPFHDMTIPIPVGYDDLLRRQYGDYMTPVRANQLHTNILVNCERSYKDVLAELRKQQNSW